MVILYNILLVVLYAAGALFLGSQVGALSLFHDYRSNTIILWVSVFAVIIYALHYAMLFGWKRKWKLSKISVIALCVIEFFCYFPIWAIIALAQLPIFHFAIAEAFVESGMVIIEALQDLFSFENIPFHLLSLFIITRVFTTIKIFRKTH